MPQFTVFSAFILLFLLCISKSTNALECYVCENQEDNLEKCVSTIKTCNYDEDVCLTEVKWGTMPYFQEGALKQFFISKHCASQDKCYKYRSSNMQYCTHIWYQDWKCSECCKGDRCNYYVISAAQTNRAVFSVSLSIVLTTILYKFFTLTFQNIQLL